MEFFFYIFQSTPSHFVPTNMAVNFVQHNRCMYNNNNKYIHMKKKKLCRKQLIFFPLYYRIVNVEDAESKRRRQRQQEERERNGEGGQRFGLKRATDDYHYDKFRKQFRRY